MSGKFEIFKSEKNNQYYFTLKASNGKIILQSEGYTTKEHCHQAVEAVQANAIHDEAFERHPNHFTIKSLKNHKVIGTSENYTTTHNRDLGIRSVQRNAPDAKVIDLTQNKMSLR